MKLITKELDKQLEKQGKLVRTDQVKGLKAIAHIFHPLSSYDAYLIGYSMEDNKDYVFALVKGFEVEYGDVYIPEMEEVKISGLSMERDLYFMPTDVEELYKKLKGRN